jgi:inner membrane protein
MGAALGKAGLATRTTLGMSTLVIANNLPDIDVAVFATNTLAMSFRRGWTHGVLAQALLPLALTGTMLAYDRFVVHRSTRRNASLRAGPVPPKAKFGELLLLSYIGVLTHVFMDCLNSYGVRLLMPFSGYWFYGDALYIVDPWLYLALGAGWGWALRRERRGSSHAARPARIGVVIAAAYMLVMLGSNLLARATVRDGLMRAGQPAATRFMVTPVLLNPFKREVVVDVGGRYEKGIVWFEPLPHFRPSGFGIDTGLDDPAVQPALQTPLARAYLSWSRFPFAAVDTAGPSPGIWLNDYRYANVGLGGWSAIKIVSRTQIQ